MILHSQILGEGAPFVILHGFLGMSDNWKTLGMRWAEDGYEVHLIDLRNHGRSFHSEDFSIAIMAEDVKEYCTAHNINQMVLLGHSMGGKVAMQFAAEYPGMVSHLIIADIGPKQYPPHHQDILKALSSLDLSDIKSRGEAEDALSAYIKDRGTRLFLLKNLYRNKKKQYALRLNLPILTKKMEEIGAALAPEAVYNGKVLFLAGQKSRYIQPTDESLIRKHFPDSEIEEIPGAGHWLHAEKPEKFYRITHNFLKG